jgi:hypothetical protein
MTFRTASALACLLACLTAPVAAEPLPLSGRYRCVLTSRGNCAVLPESRENFCMSYPITRGARAHLQLDFDSNLATMDGRRGTILPGGPGGNGPPTIAWDEPALLGTPSIAFERAPEALPLRSYMSSLRLFLDLPDSRMLPAHGEANRLTRSRAQELLDHHRERLDRVAELVAAGAGTAFEAARCMRWTRRERRLDELDTVHRMTAVLEVLAHLDLLVAEGVLTAHNYETGCAFAVR